MVYSYQEYLLDIFYLNYFLGNFSSFKYCLDIDKNIFNYYLNFRNLGLRYC